MILTVKATAVLFVLLQVASGLKTDQRGRSFLIAFLEKDNDIRENLIAITSEDDATVYVKISNTETQVYEIESMGAVQVPFPRSANRMTSDIQVTGNTAFIVASTKVSVYGYAIGNTSIGGFLALPVENLGTRYLTVANRDGGQLAVAATEDDTEVTIVMKLGETANCGDLTLRDGQVLTFRLQRRQAAHMACDKDTSGTLIQATKPVAVFTGSSFSEAVEMVPPIEVLGMEYILYPIPGRNAATFYRILAVDDETVVTSSKWTYKLVSQGLIDITVQEKDYTCFRSTKPVMVAQFMQSKNGQILSILPSTDHFAADYVMDTTVGGYSRNVISYITAVIPKTTPLEFSFMPSSSVHVIDECGYRVGTAKIPSGIIKLSQSNGSPFGIMAYGFGQEEMYSYSAGFTFESSVSDTKGCVNVTCGNNGLCYNALGSYECLCAEPFTGRHCELNRSSETTSELPTTEEAFTSEIVSTDLSTTDIPSPETTVTDATPMCECKCTNITLEEVYEQVEEVKKELTVDKKLLSKEKRKRATMEDTRPTSTGVGYVGSALLIIIFGSIMVIDLISAGRYILGRINEKHKVKQTCNGVGVAYRRKHLIHVQPEGIVLHMTDRTDYRLEVFARRRPAPVQS